MQNKPFVFAAALALLPLAALAQTAPTPPTAAVPATGGITLRYKFKPGETRRYKVTMDMAMTMGGMPKGAQGAVPPINEHMEMVLNQTAQSINATNGAATLVSRIVSMNATMNGQPLPAGAMNNMSQSGFTTVISPTGKVLSVELPPSMAKNTTPGMDLSNLGGLGPAVLPENAVQVGDKWSGNADLSRVFGSAMPGMGSGMKMSMLSTLAGIENGASPSADIHQTIEGTINMKVPATTASAIKTMGNITGENLMKFDINEGGVASQDMTMNMHMTIMPPAGAAQSGMTSPLKMNMLMKTHMERLPGSLPDAVVTPNPV